MAEILPDTRVYDGCQGVELYFNMENRDSMILLEYRDSREHHEKYIGWRTETGVMGKIGSMLAGQPSIRYLEKTET